VVSGQWSVVSNRNPKHEIRNKFKILKRAMI
jgi:hypothetical protein